MSRKKKSEGEETNNNEVELTFERALSELEEIVSKLEKEDLSLDNALKYFERGVNLIRICENHLNSAKGKMTELIKGENGKYIEKILGESLEFFLKQKEEILNE